MKRGALTLGLLLTASTAQAHLIETGLGPLYDGITHFWITPEDLLPTLAIALLAGLRGKGHARAALFALIAAWLIGGLLGLAFPVPAAAGPHPWIPLLALGLLVAADFSLALRTVTAIAIVAGLWLGWQNGAAIATTPQGFLSVLGTVISAFVFTTIACAVVVGRNSPLARTISRVAGSWIAASGVLLLGWSLR